MDRSLNITLPEETVQLIDQLTQKGDLSQFINQAVNYYIHEKSKATLRKQLQEGAIRRADRDLNLTEEWFALEEEPWQSTPE
ncbi:hypothetical protein ACKFKF_29075 [Phormidesmis sp. 146-12]